jgi:hypothetical protein
MVETPQSLLAFPEVTHNIDRSDPPHEDAKATEPSVSGPDRP